MYANDIRDTIAYEAQLMSGIQLGELARRICRRRDNVCGWHTMHHYARGKPCMFKARGTRIVGEAERSAANPDSANPISTQMDLIPVLPLDFVARVRAAQDGDLDAIAEMRAIGDKVPAAQQAAFAEMVEDLISAA